jgi:2,3-dihydroxybenzoate-AMP ligase
VVVQLPNVPEFVYTYFALARIGAIPVTALRAHRHTEVSHFLRASGAAAYVIPDVLKGFDYRAMAHELAPQAPALATVFVAGEPASGQRSLWLLARPGDRRARRFVDPSGDDHAVVGRHGVVSKLTAHP